MLIYILLVVFAGLAWSAPAPVHVAKPLALVSDLKTPASTAKLEPLVAPIAAPLLAPIPRLAYAAPILPQSYAYAYPAPVPPLEIPTTYSIEQHGYHITY